MRFITGVPEPIFVDGHDTISRCIQHCWVAKEGVLGVDTETLGKGYLSVEDQVVVLGLCPDESTRYLVPRKHLQHFKPLLESDDTAKAIHNWKFDAHRLLNAGISLGGDVYDTLSFDFLVDEDTRENRHSLDQCAKDYFGIPMAKYKDLFGKIDPRFMRPGHELWAKYLDYSTLDPWVHRKLALHHRGLLQKIMMWEDQSVWDYYLKVEQHQIRTLLAMERRGIHIDTEELDRLAKMFSARMDEAAGLLCQLVGRVVNINSNKQLIELFHGEMGLPVQSLTAGGDPQMTAATLSAMAEQGVVAAQYVMDYKKASKLLGTYAQGLRKWIARDGNIHTRYSPLALTGRLRSADPNLQNIPSRTADGLLIRGAFVPDKEDDCLLIKDYEQLEMRLIAAYAHHYGDPTMADAINKGLEMHSYTATMFMRKLGFEVTYESFLEGRKAGNKQIVGYRTAFKDVGFGIVYGRGPRALAEGLTAKLGKYVSDVEAAGYIDEYLNMFPGVRYYLDDQKSFAREHGYVQTMQGRIRRLSAIRSKSRAHRGHAERQAINTPIQGSAADVVKLAMIACENDPELRDLGAELRLQVHDELGWNVKDVGWKETSEGWVPRDLARIKRINERASELMEHPLEKDLPVRLDTDGSWGRSWKAAK